MRESFVELGIVVRSVRSGDFDARLAIFTATGLKWLTAKGVYRPKAKLAAAISLFTVAEWTGSGKSITVANVLVSPFGLTKDLHRYYLACAIADSLTNLEFVEQAPQALVAAINAITALSTTDQSCYVIFLDYFIKVLTLLGYDFDQTYDAATLTHSQAKQLVTAVEQSFITNVDYRSQFCDMMY